MSTARSTVDIPGARPVVFIPFPRHNNFHMSTAPISRKHRQPCHWLYWLGATMQQLGCQGGSTERKHYCAVIRRLSGAMMCIMITWTEPKAGGRPCGQQGSYNEGGKRRILVHSRLYFASPTQFAHMHHSRKLEQCKSCCSPHSRPEAGHCATQHKVTRLAPSQGEKQGPLHMRVRVAIFARKVF